MRYVFLMLMKKKKLEDTILIVVRPLAFRYERHCYGIDNNQKHVI